LPSITVTKNDHFGNPVLSYEAQVVSRGETWICVEAQFARHEVDLGVVVFREGDLMTEWFYTDRYYNIFQIRDATSQAIKGWYCNITRPARITGDEVAADDLALDVFVSPSGDITLLDEEDFNALDLTDKEREAVRRAVESITAHVKQGMPPFDAIVPSP
jgi:predicted RNA-binding protein associated with RNAse of E/G family